MSTSPLHAVARYLLAYILAFSLCLPTAGLAYATPDGENTPPETNEASQADSVTTDDADAGAGESAHSHGDSADQGFSTCIPSEEDIAKWEADGTLDERIAFQESLGNGEVSSSLIAQAQRRAAGPTKLRSSSGNLPSNVTDDLSMATKGDAKVLALLVDFPIAEGSEATLGFDGRDTVEALQALIGSPLPSSDITSTSQAVNPNAAFAPYDSLNSYYKRSSYGKLNISGTAFEYTAAHPRDQYTGNIDALFAEALEYLDTTKNVNFADYDADGDGYIDAVYLHFAGNNSEWGTTWWSNCSFYQESEGKTIIHDEKKLGCKITLHQPSYTEEGVRTAIHETGHALGLPDYYSYGGYGIETDRSYRTGILTFDMMNNNLGDHNAYSKWLLGWIDDEDITRVVANAEGTTVKKGEQDPVFTAADESGESSAEAVLELLTNDEAKHCGGFIAVSNNERLLEPLGLFSSFYLLEYNGYAGNQIVEYVTGYDMALETEITEPIPSGFRLFRIQADLTTDNSSFVHENRYDSVHDQFIELVDHDGHLQHYGHSNLADSTNKSPYECMMTEGDVITPTGSGSVDGGVTSNYPTTNFFENINRGFTGLSIAVKTSEKDSGQVEISYSTDAKPDLTPDSLELTQTKPRAVSNIDALYLTGSIPLMRVPGSMLPYLEVGSTTRNVSVEEVKGSTVKLSYALPPELFENVETCELVFPEGFFLIGAINGEDIHSNEIRVTLSIEDAVEIDMSGDYADAASDKHIVSNVVTTDTGVAYFATSDKDQVKVHEVDSSAPAEINTNVVEGLDASGAYRLRLAPLSNGKLCLIASSYMSDYGTMQTAYWLNPSNSSIEASCELGGQDFSAISSYEDSLITTWSYTFEEDYSTILMLAMFTPKGDNFEVNFWQVDGAGAIFPVANSSGDLAFVGKPWSSFDSVVKIVSPSTLAQSSDDYGVIGFQSLSEKKALNVSEYSGSSAFAYTDGGYLAITYDEPEAFGSPDISDADQLTGNADSSVPAWRDSTDLKGYLVSFDDSGSVVSSKLFSTFPQYGATFTSLRIGPDGTPVAEVLLGEDSFDEGRRMFFFRDGIANAPITLSNDASATGAWLLNSAWIEIGLSQNFGPAFGEGMLESGRSENAGSPSPADGEGGGENEGGLGEGFEGEIGSGYEQESRPVHYLAAFMPDNSNDGGEGGAGDTEEGDGNGAGNGAGGEVIPGSGSSANSGSSLSKTGDGTGLAAIAFGGIAAGAGALALLAFAFSRKNKRR